MNDDLEGKRGLGFEKDIQGEFVRFPRQNLKIFAVAIDEYEHTNYWPKLEYPVTDCERLLGVLKDRYGAECVVELYNTDATFEKVKGNILELTTGGAKELGPEDDLIILFSGHSYRSGHGVGGFVMHDSGDADKPQERDKMINPTWLFNQFKQMSAWRILLVVDTCYGLQFSKVQVDSLPDSGKLTLKQEFRPGRWTLSSSRDGEAPDYSLFMRGIAGLLDRNEEEQLLLNKLVGELSTDLQNFKQDLPTSKDLVTDDKLTGDFVFSRKMPEPYPKKSHLEFLELLRKGSSKYLEDLSKGRFCYARIEELLPGADSGKLMSTEVEVAKKRMLLTTSVREKRKDTGKPNLLLLGDGGMGKTTSLLHLWESMLTCQEDPIPIFIALNEYNHARKGAQKNYLTWYIARHYLGIKDPDSYLVEDQLWNLLQVNPIGGQPQITLLLDGFNEVSSDQTALLEELSWSSKAKNVQIVLTSRYVETRRFIWAQHMEEVHFLPLEEDLIRKYLAAINLDYPKDKRLQSLLTTPMMLASYAKTEYLAETYGGEHSPYFFHEAKTEAEILWNFNEALLAKAMDIPGDTDDRNEDGKNSLKEYIVRKLLPYLAWRMEKEGLFFIPLESNRYEQLSFDSIVMDAFGELAYMDLAFAKNKGKATGRGITAKEKRKRIEQMLNILKDDIHLLIQEGDELRFLHQNFRDFYAACHLLNCIKFSLAEDERPEEWHERAFPVYLRKMIGELEGEYKFDPFEAQEEKTELLPNCRQVNWLSRLLEQFRGAAAITRDNTVWNLLTILNETRGTLAGADLSMLDLSGFNLNKFLFSAFRGKSILTANLNGAKLTGNVFLYSSHGMRFNGIKYGGQGFDNKSVETGCYNPDNTTILTASHDTTIMEWSVVTGQYVKSFIGHKHIVGSVTYSPKGNRVLSISYDGVIKEWDAFTTDCVRSIAAHESGGYASVTYNHDGSRFLSVSHDGWIREWSAETGDCLLEFTPSGDVLTAIYSPNSTRILSISKDGVAREWSKETRDLLMKIGSSGDKILSGVYNLFGNRILLVTSGGIILEHSIENDIHTLLIDTEDETVIAIYSPLNSKILSASKNGKVTEWLVETQKRVKVYQIDNSEVVSMNYSPDGNRILCVYKNGIVREWSVQTGECIHTLNEYTEIVKSAIYSFDGCRILSASDDTTMREWSLNAKKCIRTYVGHHGRINSAVYNRLLNTIISCSSDHTIKEWSISNGKCLRTLNGHIGNVNTINYNLDNSRVLSCSDDNTVREWSVATGECVQVFRGHGDRVTSAVYDSTGQNILSASKDGTIRVWSVKTGECLKNIFIRSYGGFKAIYHPSDSLVLTFGFRVPVREWSLDSEVCISEIMKSGGGATSAAYSKNGSRILLGCGTSIIREWDTDRKEFVRTFSGHNNHISSVMYNPNGDSILSASRDGTIRVWSIELSEIIQGFISEPGLYIQGLDLRNLHPDSVFTEEEKERMRKYGAIFDDQDKADWDAAVEDAYGDMEE